MAVGGFAHSVHAAFGSVGMEMEAERPHCTRLGRASPGRVCAVLLLSAARGAQAGVGSSESRLGAEFTCSRHKRLVQR